MKIKTLLILSLLFEISSCGYDVLDSKPGDPINTVSNLNYTISGSQVTLTWDLPTSYPNDVIQPVSIFIRVTKGSKDNISNEYPLYNPNALNAGTFTIDDAPTSFVYDQYDPNFTYRFTVKVMARINVESVNFSNLRYSPGITIEI